MELRILSDEERWDDAVRTIPWKADTLYSLTIRNLSIKAAAGMKSPDLQYESAHGIWELASNKKVHRHILDYRTGIPDATEGPDTYVPPNTSDAVEEEGGDGALAAKMAAADAAATAGEPNPVFESLEMFFTRGVYRAREPASAAAWSLAPVAAMRRELIDYGLIKAMADMVERDNDAMDHHLGPADGPRWNNLSGAERARQESMAQAKEDRLAAKEAAAADFAAEEAAIAAEKAEEAARIAAEKKETATAEGSGDDEGSGSGDGEHDDAAARIAVDAVATPDAGGGSTAVEATDDAEEETKADDAAAAVAEQAPGQSSEFTDGFTQEMADHMMATQVNVMGTFGILMVDRACRDAFFTDFPNAGPLLTTWRLRPKPGNIATPLDPRVLAADALCTALQRDEDIRGRFARSGGLSGLAQCQIKSDLAIVRVAAVSALATYMSSAEAGASRYRRRPITFVYFVYPRSADDML